MHEAPKAGKSHRLPVTLTSEEEKALLAAVNSRSTTGLRNRAMLAAMLEAGLRVSEVAALRPADVDFSEGTIRVNLGKGRKDRVVPVNGETLGWLRAWAEKRKALELNGRHAFFCGVRHRGEALSPRAVQAMLTVLVQRAGLEGKRISPHVLRHTYATRMLDQGFTIREVQQLLGHSSVITTQVYTHVNDKALKAKVQGQAVKADLAAQIVALQGQLEEMRRAAGL